MGCGPSSSSSCSGRTRKLSSSENRTLIDKGANREEHRLLEEDHATSVDRKGCNSLADGKASTSTAVNFDNEEDFDEWPDEAVLGDVPYSSCLPVGGDAVVHHDHHHETSYPPPPKDYPTVVFNPQGPPPQLTLAPPPPRNHPAAAINPLLAPSLPRNESGGLLSVASSSNNDEQHNADGFVVLGGEENSGAEEPQQLQQPRFLFQQPCCNNGGAQPSILAACVPSPAHHHGAAMPSIISVETTASHHHHQQQQRLLMASPRDDKNLRSEEDGGHTTPLGGASSITSQVSTRKNSLRGGASSSSSPSQNTFHNTRSPSSKGVIEPSLRGSSSNVGGGGKLYPQQQYHLLQFLQRQQSSVGAIRSSRPGSMHDFSGSSLNGFRRPASASGYSASEPDEADWWKNCVDPQDSAEQSLSANYPFDSEKMKHQHAITGPSRSLLQNVAQWEVCVKEAANEDGEGDYSLVS